jgi:hypothetical protein
VGFVMEEVQNFENFGFLWEKVVASWKHNTKGPCWAIKCVFFFWYILYYFEGNFSLISSSILTYKINFDTKVSNIIFIIFQMKVIFIKTFSFQQTYVCLNEKLVQFFFVKSHVKLFNCNWNGTINSYSMYN